MIFAVLLITGPGTAQAPADSKAKANPRSFDPHDLSGVWMPNKGVLREMIKENSHPPMTPWAQERFDATIPTQGSRRVAGKENDPFLKCEPFGIPKILIDDQPFELVQVPGRVFQFFEIYHIWRTIWTDGRELPNNPDPTWMGYSVGKWDGDTFVVDTVGVSDRTWVDFFGDPHSDAMHVTERYRRVDQKALSIAITIDDPKAYAKSWVNPPFLYTLEPWEIAEHFCIFDEESQYGRDIRIPSGSGQVPGQK